MDSVILFDGFKVCAVSPFELKVFFEASFGEFSVILRISESNDGWVLVDDYIMKYDSDMAKEHIEKFDVSNVLNRNVNKVLSLRVDWWHNYNSTIISHLGELENMVSDHTSRMSALNG